MKSPSSTLVVVGGQHRGGRGEGASGGTILFMLAVHLPTIGCTHQQLGRTCKQWINDQRHLQDIRRRFGSACKQLHTGHPALKGTHFRFWHT